MLLRRSIFLKGPTISVKNFTFPPPPRNRFLANAIFVHFDTNIDDKFRLRMYTLLTERSFEPRRMDRKKEKCFSEGNVEGAGRIARVISRT